MSPNKITTSEKLRMFEASPNSSQDFEVSSSQIDFSQIIASKLDDVSSDSGKVCGNKPKIDVGSCSKRKSINPITSTQLQPKIKRSNIVNENVSREMSHQYSTQSSIEESNVNAVIDDSFFNMTSSPRPKEPTFMGDSYMSFHTDKAQENNSSRHLDIERQPLNINEDIINNSNKIDISEQFTNDALKTDQKIDADHVIELVTREASQSSNCNQDVNNLQNNNRQFPGPAGILPRLHAGLESNPGLAKLMRLHKGSDLKKFSRADKHSNHVNRSPTGNSNDEDQRIHDRHEFVENNELWNKMLNDEKLASEGYHELMAKFNIQFIKQSGEVGYVADSINIAGVQNPVECIAKTPLLISTVKWIDLAAGHQDPTCQLIDKTGAIYGQLSSEIISQYGWRIQPGTVLVLRNLAILSTLRNVYVNITLANMIALFWLTPSTENGPSRTPGIFGKRIVRVTKEDILRDAKIIEEESRAELQAQQACLQTQIKPNNFAPSYGNTISPSSSTSSVPSSIRAPMNNIRHGTYNNGNKNQYVNNQYSPIRPNFRPHSSSSPSLPRSNYSCTGSGNNFRSPMPRRPDPSFQQDLQSQTAIPRHSISMQPRFDFNPSSRSSPINQKENKSVNHNTFSTRTIIDNTSSSLLEGLDEDSLFGDFQQDFQSPTAMPKQHTISVQPKFNFNPNSRSSPIKQRENNSVNHNTFSTRTIIDNTSSSLLDGLDEDSLFGDF